MWLIPLLAVAALAVFGGSQAKAAPRAIKPNAPTRGKKLADQIKPRNGPLPEKLYLMQAEIERAYPRTAELGIAGLIVDYADQLGMHPYDFANVIFFESGAGFGGPSFNPDAVNPKSGASGLIQFMPNTAAKLFYPKEHARTPWSQRGPLKAKAIARVRQMNAEQQLGLAAEYLRRVKAGQWDDKVLGPLNTTQAVFMAVFYPWARYENPNRPFGKGYGRDGAAVAKQTKSAATYMAKAMGLVKLDGSTAKRGPRVA